MKAFRGPKRQGGWVVGALYAATAIAQGVSSAFGAREAKKAEKNQKQAIRFRALEEFRDQTKLKEATLGTQQARYAASGVDVNVGSVAKVLEETRNEYARTVAANAYLKERALKGASTEAKTAQYAAIGSYFSAAGSFAAGARDAWRNKASFWGTGN